MRRIVLLSIAVAVLLAGAATAQASRGTGAWDQPRTLEEYNSWSLDKKIEIYRAIVEEQFYVDWADRTLPEREAWDPSLGAYDPLLEWLPLSPQDMLEIDMLLRHYEVAVPYMTHLLHRRWLDLHFGPSIEPSPYGAAPTPDRGAEDAGAAAAPPDGGPLATVGTNRNSAYDYSPAPDNYDGEIQIAVNPLNANQIVSMANTWDNMGDTANCGGGTQAIFFSSNGGASWGYTCAPRGSLYSGLSCTNEAGSDPALFWDGSNNIYADYMSLCYNATWTSVNGYAMVVAKSTDGGANWTPHGVLQNSYSTGNLEDKNFYIIDTNATSPYSGRHYSCWDRSNNELFKYSTNGGVSWTEVNIPNVGSGLDLGCEMAVEDNGTIHLIFDNLTCGVSTCSDEDMYYTRSTNGGASWSSLVHVRDMTNPISFGSSSKYGPQDKRGLNPFGAIDVDNSGGACDGNLYVTFTDDADGNGVGTADIWVMRSTNGGSTWGSAVRVNDTANPDTSIQFHPFLVVDQSTGYVFVAWHDARNDPSNSKVDFYVARSTDCGQTWTNVQASQPSSEFNNSSISYTDENSSDNANYNPNQFGEYLGLDVHNGTAYLAWTDTRHFYPGSSSNAQKENVGFAKVTFCTANAPTSLSAAASGNNAIQLSWSAASGAAEYRVYRSTTSGSGYTQVGTVTAPATSYLDTNLQGGVTYYYVVTNYDGSQSCESSYSSEASATATGPCDLAPTFSGVSSATASGCAIDLGWSAATANCGGPVSYSVYRSTASGFTPALSNRIAAGLSGTTYTDGNGIAVGTTYYYKVRASDESNGQEDSNTAEASAATSASSSWLDDVEAYANIAAAVTAGWSHAVGTGSDDWAIGSINHTSGGSRSFTSSDVGSVTDKWLIAPAKTVTASSQLTFWHRYQFEEGSLTTGYDGGVIEISTNGGSSWSDLGGSITSGGYTHTISSSYSNPLAGRQAWSGNQTTYTQVTVDLSGYAGQSILVRWRMGCDSSVSDGPWYIDDIQITNLSGGGCSSTPSDVAYLTARSTSGQVKLEWVNPSGTYGSTRICRDTTGYPSDPTACATVVADVAGTAGAYDTYTDSGVTNANTHYYTAFVNNGSSVFSGGVHAWAYPFATTGKVKWSYSSAASALAPSGVRPGPIGAGGTWAVSNDRMLHGMNPTTAGGDWPRTTPYSWQPMAMNGPAQARPPVVPTTAVSGANQVIFLGSEDGHAYAVNAETGTTLWQSPALGSILLASPAGMFTDFGGGWNRLFIGSRDATADIKMYMLDPANSNIITSFNNGGGANGIGIISSAAAVDYATNRIYFASRRRSAGSSDTLWCLSFTGTSFTKAWSVALGDIDGAPVLYQGRLYVGNTGGTVYAVNPASGATYWSYAASGDGAVKGFVTPEGSVSLPRSLYFSTTTKVWSITDNTSSAAPGWSVTTVPGPSVPLVPVGASVLYVGSSNGNLYQLNAATGAVQSSVQLGDGTATIGSPALDVVNGMAYVGSESGAVYGVVLPLQ